MLKSYLEKLSPTKKYFLETALNLGVKINVLSDRYHLLELNYKNKTTLIINEELFFNQKIGTLFSKNKEVTKILLSKEGISVAKGFVAVNYEEAVLGMKKNKINFPVVVKPIDAARGIGVTVGVDNLKKLKTAISRLNNAIKECDMRCSGEFLIEEMFYGSDYRILVLNNKVIACYGRVPAFVVGDGKSSIEKLVNDFNSTRSSHFKIKIDDEIKDTLKEKKLNSDSILKKDFRLQLRLNANISTGGIAVDMTEKISPYFKNIAIKCAKALQLNFCGVDIMADDLSLKKENQKYCIIEVNGSPNIGIFTEKEVYPGDGKKVIETIVKEVLK